METDSTPFKTSRKDENSEKIRVKNISNNHEDVELPEDFEFAEGYSTT